MCRMLLVNAHSHLAASKPTWEICITICTVYIGLMKYQNGGIRQPVYLERVPGVVLDLQVGGGCDRQRPRARVGPRDREEVTRNVDGVVPCARQQHALAAAPSPLVRVRGGGGGVAGRPPA